MPDTQPSEGAIEDANTGYLAEVELPNTGDPSQSLDDKADSSTADKDAKDEGPTSVLDAIKDAMDKTTDEGDGDPSNAEAEEEGKDLAAKDPDPADADKKPADADQDKKPEGDDEKPPPFHEHPRWKAMLKERDELRAQFDGVKGDVEVARNLRDFASNTGLSDVEISDGLRIMALMKENPAAALESMKPYMEALETVTGERLPDDLNNAVDEGAITPELASELARARGETGIAQQRVEKAQQTLATNNGAHIGEAVQTWTDQWQQSDPDASVKLPRVMDRVKVSLMEGFRPQSPQQAIDHVKGIVNEVTKEIEALKPARPARKAITGGGRTPSQAKSEPTSMLEVVQQATGS